MNGSVRREIAFAEHASVLLFECLIVAGAPATGLLQDTGLKDRGTLQIALQLLRDMWQRADTLYIPRGDLESLHRMECNSTLCHEMRVPDQIAIDARKLSRYYIYLLFRYCMSFAVSPPYSHEGAMSNRLIGMSQWGPKKDAAPLVDIPGNWLGTNVCTNYPLAPPLPEGTFVSGFPNYPPPQQQQQQLREYHREMDYTKQDPRLLLQPTNKQSLYPTLTEHQPSGLSHPKPFRGPDKLRTKKVFSKCYDSNVESGEDY